MTTTYKDSYQESKTLSAEEFLSLTEEQKKQIQTLEILVPKLGSSSMGTFRVVFEPGASVKSSKAKR
jgi:hypothetical protein